MPFDQATGKALVVSLVGASTARVSASAVKAIPGGGIVPCVVAQAGFAAASTFAVGQLFRAHFEAQRGISELEPETLRKSYDALVQKGRAIFRGLFARDPSFEEKAEVLERLTRLRASNAIIQTEFERLKHQALAEEEISRGLTSQTVCAAIVTIASTYCRLLPASSNDHKTLKPTRSKGPRMPFNSTWPCSRNGNNFPTHRSRTTGAARICSGRARAQIRDVRLIVDPNNLYQLPRCPDPSPTLGSGSRAGSKPSPSSLASISAAARTCASPSG